MIGTFLLGLGIGFIVGHIITMVIGLGE